MGTGARLASRRRCRRGQVEQRAVGRGSRSEARPQGRGERSALVGYVHPNFVVEVGLSAEGGLG